MATAVIASATGGTTVELSAQEEADRAIILTLAEAQKAKAAAIDAKRDAILKAGKTVLGMVYDARFDTAGALVSKGYRAEKQGGAAQRTITNISSAAEAVFTVTGGAPDNDQEVLIASVGGPTELNGNVYYVSDASGNTFKLKDRLGNYVDTTGMGAYVSGGTATVVVTFIAKDNSMVALPFDDAVAVWKAIGKFYNDVCEQARTYKNEMLADGTVAGTNAYNTHESDANWPT